MRLLLFNYELPPIGGGGGRAMLRLAQEFVRLGHEAAIVTSAFGRFPRQESIPVGGDAGVVRVLRIPAWRPNAERCPPHHMLTFVASSLWHLPRLAARLRPDLVFAFFGIPCGPAALRVRRCLGIPYALSLRGSDVPRPELGHQRLLEAVTRPVLRRVWRSADALIAVGGDLRAAVLAVEPTLDVKVIPNGVDAERFRPPSAKTRTPGALRLLFVGRLREFKGLQFCIEALAQRPASAPRVSLDIVGEGPYRGRLEDMVERHGLAGQVRFLGWLEPARVPDYYASADALALPSYAEGSPNVILEAMAAGLAVLTSDAPGCREMVEHGKEGLLLPVGDVGAWRAAIDRLASTPELVRAMGATGMAKARAFSWTEVARRHLEIFERIV